MSENINRMLTNWSECDGPGEFSWVCTTESEFASGLIGSGSLIEGFERNGNFIIWDCSLAKEVIGNCWDGCRWVRQGTDCQTDGP